MMRGQCVYYTLVHVHLNIVASLRLKTGPYGLALAGFVGHPGPMPIVSLATPGQKAFYEFEGLMIVWKATRPK